MINLLIDRVGNVNIFNFMDQTGNSESHIHSKIDSDLLQEYVREIENIARISRSVRSREVIGVKPDTLKELKSLGETFFDQFFPLEIAEKLRSSGDKFLHFNIDQGLKDIPWELLYDGSGFLGDKFFIGKTVKGAARSNAVEDNRKLKMLIIADPNEDLEWAQREGEELFTVLREKISPNLLEIHFVAGRQITKLKLLSLIKGKHIIHYAGHLFFSEEPLENGWLLSEGKVLKAREISNSGSAASLVFSNSCLSSKATNEVSTNAMNFFAGSFLMSGIKCFVGTNWEVSDNERTLDFTVRFYLSLFNHKSVGESLFLAREFARRNYESWDLTWTNYTLHGNPDYILLNAKREGKTKVVDLNFIKKFMPTPIAKSYLELVEKDFLKSEPRQVLGTLVQSFEQFSKIIGLIIFSDHNKQALGKIKTDDSEQLNLMKWWDSIFSSMWDFKKLEISMSMDTIMETLSTQREMIYKMILWSEKFRQGQIEEDFVQGYLVTFQYYFENLLMELKEFDSVSFLYFHESNSRCIAFIGTEPRVISGIEILDFPATMLSATQGKIILYNKNRKVFVPIIGMNVMTHENSNELVINENTKLLQSVLNS